MIETFRNRNSEANPTDDSRARMSGIVDKTALSDKLSGMETITVRELQKNLRQTLARVQRGATLRVTRHRRVVAEIGPARPAEAPKAWPDLQARAESVLGRRVLSPGAAQQILDDRG